MGLGGPGDNGDIDNNDIDNDGIDDGSLRRHTQPSGDRSLLHLQGTARNHLLVCTVGSEIATVGIMTAVALMADNYSKQSVLLSAIVTDDPFRQSSKITTSLLRLIIINDSPPFARVNGTNQASPVLKSER